MATITEFLVKYNGDAKEFTAADKKVNDSLEKTDAAATKKSGSIGKTMGNIGKGFAAVGTAAVAAAGAVFKFTDNVSKQLDSIDKGSQKMGVSAEAYQEWSQIMQLGGSSVEALEKGTKQLALTAVEAAAGSEKYADAYKELNVELKNADGSMRSQEAIMADTIKGLSSMEDETKRNALASQLFGRAGQELIPVLNMGSDAIQKEIDLMRENGSIMGGDAVKAGANFQDMMTRVTTSLKAQAMEIGVGLMPVITQLIDDVLPPLMSLLKSIIPILEPIIDIAVDFINQLIPFLTTILEAIQPILPLVADLVGSLLNGILPPLLQILEKLLPPIIGLLEMILSYVTKMLDAILPLFGELVDALLPVIVSLLEALMPILEPLLQIFTALLTNLLVPMLKWLINEGLGPVLEKFTAVFEYLGGAIPGVIEWFTGLWDGIKNVTNSVLRFFGVTREEVAKTEEEVVAEMVAGTEKLTQTTTDWAANTQDVYNGWNEDSLRLFQQWAKDNGQTLETWSEDTGMTQEEWKNQQKTLIEEWKEDQTTTIADTMAANQKAVEESNANQKRSFKEWASDTWGTVTDWCGNVVGSIGTWASDMIGAIVQWGKDMWDALVTWKDDTIASIGGWITDFVQIGKDMLQGIVQGMIDAVGGIGEWIKKICGGIVDGFKNFFGISSPSTLAAKEIGGPILDGILKPIEKVGEGLKKTLEGQAGKIKDSFYETGKKSVEALNKGIDSAAEETKKSVQGIVNTLQKVPDMTFMQSVMKPEKMVIAHETEGIITEKQDNKLHVYAHVSPEFEEDLQNLTQATYSSNEKAEGKESQFQLNIIYYFQNLIDEVKKTGKSLEKFFEKQMEKIEKFFDKLFETMKKTQEKASESFEDILDKLDNLIAQWKTSFTNLMDRIDKFWKELSEFLEESFTQLFQAISDAAQTIGDYVKDAAQTITNATNTIGAKVIQYLNKITQLLERLLDDLKMTFKLLQELRNELIGGSVEGNPFPEDGSVVPPPDAIMPWIPPGDPRYGGGATPNMIINQNKYVNSEYNIVKQSSFFSQPGDLALMGYKS
jgi:phage-related protein